MVRARGSQVSVDGLILLPKYRLADNDKGLSETEGTVKMLKMLAIWPYTQCLLQCCEMIRGSRAHFGCNLVCIGGVGAGEWGVGAQFQPKSGASPSARYFVDRGVECDLVLVGLFFLG